ncbi:fibrocystin [Rhinophrynus dorsalis]
MEGVSMQCIRIVLKTPVDWKAGDRIVISSSSYEAHQAELVNLREVHGHMIRIWEKLHYRHTGAIHSVDDTWKIPLSAEVGLLSRHVQIMTDTECSGRILVGDYKDNNGEEYSGVLQVSNVEIENFGSSMFSAISFVNISLRSSIISSSIHHSCGGGIQATNSMNMLLHGNVIFSSAGHGIHLDGQDHIITDNLIMLIKQPTTDRSWVAGIKVNLVNDAVLYGNAVAGSERIAFHVRGQRCFPEETVWSGNVAHSSLHGVHFYWGDGFQNCTKITGFLSYKNYDYGLIFNLESNVLIDDISLIDNSVGLFSVVFDPFKYNRRHIEVRNSLIVATSPAFDCIMDRIKPSYADVTAQDRAPHSPLRGRVGILWPTFTTKPMQWPSSPWHILGSDGAVSGILKLQDVTFHGFMKSCYSEDGDICIMSNPESSNVMCPITAERTRMLQIKYQNMINFHATQRADKCPLSSGCYGTRKALFKDLDGSSLGLSPPVTVFPKSRLDILHPCLSTGPRRPCHNVSQCIEKHGLTGWAAIRDLGAQFKHKTSTSAAQAITLQPGSIRKDRARGARGMSPLCDLLYGLKRTEDIAKNVDGKFKHATCWTDFPGAVKP